MYGGVLGAQAGGGVTLLGGTLPFTGLSLIWWLLLGATLIVIGVSLLRTSHVVGRARRDDLPEVVPRARVRSR